MVEIPKTDSLNSLDLGHCLIRGARRRRKQAIFHTSKQDLFEDLLLMVLSPLTSFLVILSWSYMFIYLGSLRVDMKQIYNTTLTLPLHFILMITLPWFVETSVLRTTLKQTIRFQDQIMLMLSVSSTDKPNKCSPWDL